MDIQLLTLRVVTDQLNEGMHGNTIHNWIKYYDGKDGHQLKRVPLQSVDHTAGHHIMFKIADKKVLNPEVFVMQIEQ